MATMQMSNTLYGNTWFVYLCGNNPSVTIDGNRDKKISAVKSTGLYSITLE